MNRIFGVFFLAMMFSKACVYHNEEELYGSDCTTENVSFSLDIMPIVQTNCAISGCHVTGTGRVAFTGYEAVKSVVDDGRLAHMVIVTRSMPPVIPLTSCQISKIQAWLNQGAHNN